MSLLTNVYYQSDKVSADVISLADMKLYLKVEDTTDDDLITAIINAAVTIAEKIMNRDLLTTTYINYRNSIIGDLTLRKGKFQSLISIEYLKDSVDKTLDSDNYIVQNFGIYGKIYRILIPESYDDHPEAIKITFKTGYGDTASSIPADIINAIKVHVAFMYENRGDCDIDYSNQTYILETLPATSKLIYSFNKIVDANGYI